MSAHFLARPLALLRPGSLSRLPHRLLAASTLVRSRHSLRLLDDHLLRDIGVTRAESIPSIAPTTPSSLATTPAQINSTCQA